MQAILDVALAVGAALLLLVCAPGWATTDRCASFALIEHTTHASSLALRQPTHDAPSLRESNARAAPVKAKIERLEIA
jgi:hypothetical protein